MNRYVPMVIGALALAPRLTRSGEQKIVVDDAHIINAVRYGTVETVKSCIKNGVDVDTVDENGRPALVWAAFMGNAEMVRALVEAKADVNKSQNGLTALMAAALAQNVDIVKLLIASQADVNVKNKQGYTALMLSASTGNVRIAKLLMAAKADLGAKDNNGQTALQIAVSQNKSEMAELLSGGPSAEPKRPSDDRRNAAAPGSAPAPAQPEAAAQSDTAAPSSAIYDGGLPLAMAAGKDNSLIVAIWGGKGRFRPEAKAYSVADPRHVFWIGLAERVHVKRIQADGAQQMLTDKLHAVSSLAEAGDAVIAYGIARDTGKSGLYRVRSGADPALLNLPSADLTKSITAIAASDKNLYFGKADGSVFRLPLNALGRRLLPAPRSVLKISDAVVAIACSPRDVCHVASEKGAVVKIGANDRGIPIASGIKVDGFNWRAIAALPDGRVLVNVSKNDKSQGSDLVAIESGGKKTTLDQVKQNVLSLAAAPNGQVYVGVWGSEGLLTVSTNPTHLGRADHLSGSILHVAAQK